MIRSVDYGFPVQSVTLFNGSRVAYIDEGKGARTVLFVHGLATNALSWKKNIEGLSGQYRCIAIDLPGNGLSDNAPDEKYSMGLYARCLIDFIGRLNLSNVTLVGHSMGGQVCITALHLEPQCAKEVVLIAPAGLETFTPFEQHAAKASFQLFDFFQTPESSLRQSLEASFLNMPKDARAFINELVDLMQARPSQSYKTMLDACIKGMLQEPVSAWLKGIRQPALIIFGDSDALIPNRMMHPGSSPKSIAEAGARQMPNAKSEIIRRAGHFVQWEDATAVNKLISGWLSKQ
jgi:pimeloyl-ACP methyl ester carboxylesterase